MNDNRAWKQFRAARAILREAAELLGKTSDKAVLAMADSDHTNPEGNRVLLGYALQALLRECLHLPDDDLVGLEAIKLINKVTHSMKSGHIPNTR